MSDGPRAVLVASRADLGRAAQWVAAGHHLVAGNHHVARRLSDDGLTATPGNALLTAQDKTAILREVCEFIATVNAWKGEGHPDALVAILKATLVKACFVRAQYNRASDALGLPIFRADGGQFALAAAPARPALRYASQNASPERSVVAPSTKTNGTVLDFRSTSGLKLPANMQGRVLRPKATRNPAWMNAAENRVAALLRKSPRELKFGVRPVQRGTAMTGGPKASDPALQTMIDTVIELHAQVFFDHRSAMRGLMQRDGRPAGAMFNNVGNAALSGFAAALFEAGVPCEMGSHGCMVQTGDPHHDAVAALLGPIIYNSFPGMTQITPRSPLQARDAAPGVTVLPQVRLSRDDTAPPFHFLYAPNFQPWDSCMQGFTIDCFDTFEAVSTFARMVADTPDFTLDIRIKTSAADTAREGKGALRGLMPEDVAACIVPEHGVNDASYGSHAAAMAAAGMVVTEGPTAVVFEALERRIPVVLLATEGVTPLLPGPSLAQAVRDGTRSAVYVATCTDDLATLLLDIAPRHAGKALTDEELRPYVWV